MKKICFFATNYDHTRQRLLEDYENALFKKADLFLFCASSDLDKYKLKKFKKFGYKRRNIFAWMELRDFCKKNNIEVLVGFSGGGDVSATLFFSTLLTKTKYIAHKHGNFLWRRSDIKDFKFFIYTLKNNFNNSFFFISQFFMKRFLICSQKITSKLKKYFFLNKNKIIYAPSIINTKFYRPKNKSKARKKLGFGKNEELILYVGRVSYLKGSDFLIKIIKNNPQRKFILVGALMTKELEKENFENVVLVPSASGETLVDYYNVADLFLFLSRTEGNPLALREALACGVPSIALKIESTEPIKPVIKVTRNLKEIQKSIDNFFSFSDKKRKALSKKGRSFIVKEYSPNAWDKKFQNYFLN